MTCEICQEPIEGKVYETPAGDKVCKYCKDEDLEQSGENVWQDR